MTIITPTRRWATAGISLALGIAAVTTGSGIAAAGSDAPAGNNGHIQIDEYVMDGGNGNDPHLPCGFSVSFFGYDAGDQSANIDITPVSPTAGGTPFSVATSWHIDDRTSGNQLDNNVPISPDALTAALDGVEPAAQGYHLRVDVQVTGSQGADEKHHEIWVEPCAAVVTPEEAALAAAVTAFENGDTPEEATVLAEAAAIDAGSTPELAPGIAAAAVAAAAGSAIVPAAPAAALSLAGSTTG